MTDLCFGTTWKQILAKQLFRFDTSVELVPQFISLCDRYETRTDLAGPDWRELWFFVPNGAQRPKCVPTRALVFKNNMFPFDCFYSDEDK